MLGFLKGGANDGSSNSNNAESNSRMHNTTSSSNNNSSSSSSNSKSNSKNSQQNKTSSSTFSKMSSSSTSSAPIKTFTAKLNATLKNPSQKIKNINSRSSNKSSSSSPYNVKNLRLLYSSLLAEISTSTNPLWIDSWSLLLTPSLLSTGQVAAEAQLCETRTIEILRSICEVVIYGEQNSTSSLGLFDYFCEKNMLALLVDVARGEGEGAGVARSVSVKSQVIQTVSILVQNVRNETSLYYLLSNNYINELISIPLGNYVSEVLEELMPTYISFLKTLALRLSSSPTLFQFFVDELSGSTFPLFTAAVRAASSEYAETDSFVRLTALNIVVNVCKIEHDAIRRVIGESVEEQKVGFNLFALLTVLITRLNKHIQHISTITAADPPADHNSIADAIGEIQDQLYFINDLLQCGVRPLNVRLCEWILRKVVFSPLLKNFVTSELIPIKSTPTPPVSPLLQASPTPNVPTPSLPPSGKNINNPIDLVTPLKTAAEPRTLSFSTSNSPQTPSSLPFPGTIVGKREWENNPDDSTERSLNSSDNATTASPSTPSTPGVKLKIQYRVRWKGDPDDGSMDETKTSLWVLAQLFLAFEYKPFLRMVAVALLHPLSPAEGWEDSSSLDAQTIDDSEYVLTPALHGIVQNRCVLKHNEGEGTAANAAADAVVVVENAYRKALMKMVSGAYGTEIFLPANMLLNALVECKAVGSVILSSLKVLPPHLSRRRSRRQSHSPSNFNVPYHPLSVTTEFTQAQRPSQSYQTPPPPPPPSNMSSASTSSSTSSQNLAYPPLPPSSSNSKRTSSSASPKSPESSVSALDFELNMVSFFNLPHTQSHYLEAAGSLALAWLTRIYCTNPTKWNDFVKSSAIVKSLIRCRVAMAKECVEFMGNNVFKHMFVDLMEEQILLRYQSKKNMGWCLLNRYGAANLQNSSEVLVKKVPDENLKEKVELEDCRYAIKSFLFLRALCDSLSEGSVAENMLLQGPRGGEDIGPMRTGASTGSIGSFGSSTTQPDGDDNSFKFRTTDVADDEIMAIGELHNREKVGSETNLEGKTIFRCFPLSEFGRREGAGGAIGNNNNILGNVDIVDGKPVGNELYLVVDSSRLYLCEPMEGENGGEITQVACNCPMRNIISSATDGLWLHISLRAGEFMVKPGLGAFQKKKHPGTGKAATAAKQRLDPKKVRGEERGCGE
ncbi:hypothetical protein TL16_g10816 [Triparma laevis f. inornata]|uniref:FPL domain-containing protein n=1 Tax=Triparma laevis f. inornata TaxID=1714386 RepID=A0A9W7ENM5_9STRA|nr:hypothetical protein TL16_g10816 [Triparma laevis f. inornata]